MHIVRVRIDCTKCARTHLAHKVSAPNKPRSAYISAVLSNRTKCKCSSSARSVHYTSSVQSACAHPVGKARPRITQSVRAHEARKVRAHIKCAQRARVHQRHNVCLYIKRRMCTCTPGAHSLRADQVYGYGRLQYPRTKCGCLSRARIVRMHSKRME